MVVCVVESKKCPITKIKIISCERENRNECIDAVYMYVLSKTLKLEKYMTYSFFCESVMGGFLSKKSNGKAIKRF